MHPIGMVALGRLMGAARKAKLRELMDEDFRTLRVDQSQEDVAYVFNKYHLTSAPVVDADGRLVGVITIDDAMEALEEEAEEDIRRLAGVGDEELSDGVFEIALGRWPWLAVNLGAAILAATVISQFTETIRAFVALAVLMPIVASMGGNAGTQALTVTVRAIATRSLGAANVRRFVLREGLVGLCNGLAFAAAIGLIAGLFFQDVRLGAVIAAAMIGNLVGGGLRRGAGPDRAGEARGRSGAGVGDVRDDDDRRLRLLRVPRAGDADAGLTAPRAGAPLPCEAPGAPD